MHKLLKKAIAHQRGVSLLEAMIALVVSALGILGVAGVQLRTLSDTQNAVYRSQAMRLIEDLSERLKIQPNALLKINSPSGNPYYVVNDWDTPPASSSEDCAKNWCDADELATWDIEQWHKLVRATLPAGGGVVFPAKAEDSAQGNRRQLGILLRWRQNEHGDLSDEDKKNTNTTLLKNGNNFESGTGSPDLDAGCDAAGYVCHLQYITVSARCTTRKIGGSTKTYSCPL